MIKFIQDWLTERDNVTYCIGRFIGVIAGGEMCWKFATTGQVDYVAFAAGIAAIIAAIAAKNASEK